MLLLPITTKNLLATTLLTRVQYNLEINTRSVFRFMLLRGLLISVYHNRTDNVNLLFNNYKCTVCTFTLL